MATYNGYVLSFCIIQLVYITLNIKRAIFHSIILNGKAKCCNNITTDIYMKKYDRQKCWPYFQVLGISFEKEPSKIIRFAYDVSR